MIVLGRFFLLLGRLGPITAENIAERERKALEILCDSPMAEDIRNQSNPRRAQKSGAISPGKSPSPLDLPRFQT